MFNQLKSAERARGPVAVFIRQRQRQVLERDRPWRCRTDGRRYTDDREQRARRW